MIDFLNGITHGEDNWIPVNPVVHNPVVVQNKVKTVVRGPDGEVKQEQIAVGNICCTYGLNRLCELVATGGDASNWFGGMRIGTDNTAEASTQNALLASTGSVALTDASRVIDLGNMSLRALATFASDNPAGAASIREIGIYASSNVTTGLINRKVLAGAESIAKGASDSIEVSFDLIFQPST